MTTASAPIASTPIAGSDGPPGQTLALPLLTRAAVIYAPTVTQPVQTLALPLLTRAPVIYQPTVTQPLATQTLLLPLLTHAAIIYPPVVSEPLATQTLLLPLLTHAAIIHEPTVTQPGLELLLPLLTHAAIIYPPRIPVFARVTGRVALSVSFDFRVYAATAPFMTDGADTPAHRPFDPTLDQPLQFTRSILGADKIGQFTTGEGLLSLNNTDGRYDYLINRFAIDGRDIVIKIGSLERPLSEYPTASPSISFSADSTLITADTTNYSADMT